MTYAIVDGANVISFRSRSEAIAAFRQIGRGRSGAQLFAIAASGSFSNITSRLVQYL